MYKHTLVLEARLNIETEDTLTAEELEELVHSLDYEFSSDYATITTRIEDADFISTNRIVK